MSHADAITDPCRDLTEAELLRLVGEFAARPEQWRHLVAPDPERRRYEELLRDDDVSVWLICWSDEQIHAYSPPLWRMGSYELLEDGGLRRHALSYADELRPI